MTLVSLILQKFDKKNVTPVRCSHFTLGNPKMLSSAVLFMHTSDYSRYSPGALVKNGKNVIKQIFLE